MNYEAQADRAREISDAFLIDGAGPIDYELPAGLITLTAAVSKKVDAMTPVELQEIVDFSDVEFPNDKAFIANWRRQVVDKLVDAGMDGELWAIEVMGGEA